MAIKKVKLPNNTTEDINDPRLPAVTTTDNGKVLSVSEGIWSANSKPSYTLDEVPDGSTRALSNFLPRNGGYTMTANAAISWGNNDRTDWNTYVSGIRPMSSISSSSGAPIQYCSGINIKSRYGVQLAHAATSNRFWGRVENKSWVEFYHSDNANKSDVDWNCKKLTATAATNGLAGQFSSTRSTVWIGNDPKPLETASTSVNDTHYHLRCTSGAVDGTGSEVFKITTLGKVTAAGTITPGSDSRIKKNQEEISNEEGLDVLSRLTPKTWELSILSNDNSTGSFGAGLIAQEVKEVVPGAVTISEMAGFKDFHSLNYNTIQGYEIAAIKGLIEEVKSLKAEIAELKKQIK